MTRWKHDCRRLGVRSFGGWIKQCPTCRAHQPTPAYDPETEIINDFEKWAEKECLPLAKYNMGEGNYVFVETVVALKAWKASHNMYNYQGDEV